MKTKSRQSDTKYGNFQINSMECENLEVRENVFESGNILTDITLHHVISITSKTRKHKASKNQHGFKVRTISVTQDNGHITEFRLFIN